MAMGDKRHHRQSKKTGEWEQGVVCGLL